MPSERTRLALLNQNYRTASGEVDKLLTDTQASTTYQPVSAGLTALSALTTVGLLAQTSTSPTYAGRTITAGSTRTSVVAGNGSTANPTVDVNSFPSTHLSDSTGLARTTTDNTFAGPVSVPDAVYGSSWNGSVEVPTKNAIYDKVESLGAGSGETLIETYSAAGSTASYTFSGIAGTFNKLRLEWIVRSGSTAATANMDVVFNASTGALYDRQQLTAATTVPAAAEGLGSTAAIIGTIAGNSASTGMVGTGKLELLDYASTTFFKQGITLHAFQSSTGTGVLQIRTSVISYRSVSAISSITVTLSTGNFMVGSKVRLYGVP